MTIMTALPASSQKRPGLDTLRASHRIPGREGRGPATGVRLTDDKPPLPSRPIPHERDGRQEQPAPARPHPQLTSRGTGPRMTDPDMPARTRPTTPRPGVAAASELLAGGVR